MLEYKTLHERGSFMPRKSNASVITKSDIFAVKKSMKSHLGEQVTLVSFSGSRETKQDGKISGVFDNFFTVVSNNKRITSYNHVDLVSNHVKIVFGADKNKTKNKKKNVSDVSNN